MIVFTFELVGDLDNDLFFRLDGFALVFFKVGLPITRPFIHTPDVNLLCILLSRILNLMHENTRGIKYRWYDFANSFLKRCIVVAASFRYNFLFSPSVLIAYQSPVPVSRLFFHLHYDYDKPVFNV